MSKTVKKVASIALPIVGAVAGSFVGMPQVGAAIGGAIGGSMNGGGVPGAVLGAASGYAAGGMIDSVVGSAAGAPIPGIIGPGPAGGTGIIGAVTGGGIDALKAGASNAVGGLTSGLTSGASSLISPALTTIGNQLLAKNNADGAKEAASIQAGAVDRATAAQTAYSDKAIAAQQPYTDLGNNAVSEINNIQKDPAAYIRSNPMYNSLADDAQRRLLANQAAKGKVGSGGTAAALQDQLLQIGNGLVTSKINDLKGQATIGANAAGNVSGINTNQGAATGSNIINQGVVNSAGVIGSNNAYTKGYENQINTLLALQNIGRTPTYAPTQTLSF